MEMTQEVWDRIEALEKRVEILEEEKPVIYASSDDLQTLVRELKPCGIHSSLYKEPEPEETAAEEPESASAAV